MTPSQLYSRVLPYVPGCPETMVDQALLDAASEFAEASQIIFCEERPITLVNGRSTYRIAPGSDIGVDMVRGVFCGTRELRMVTPTSRHDEVPDWQTSKSSEPTHYGTFEEPDSITVYPRPDAVNGATIVVQATWAPGFGSTTIPDDMGRRFYRELVAGAKAILMMMPDRKWTNPQLGAMARNEFEAGVAEARIKAIRGNAAGTITARPQRFGG